MDTAHGIELCWGFGTYGRHTFTLSYTMTNVVQSYLNYDGFNVRFVNDEMSAPPHEVMTRLRVP